MEFYTNVQRLGNRIWLRYFKDGKDLSTWIDDFAPTLYVKTKEETGFKTIFDEPLKPIQSESLRHAREMIQSYQGVSGFELFGNTNWEYSYLYNRFGNRCKFDRSLIQCDVIDIETTVGEYSKGFPYPFSALERITLITHLRNGKYYVFSWKDFDVSELNTLGLPVFKRVCKDEDDMLLAYVKFWKSEYPHAVTHWNGDSFDVPYIINRIRQRHGDKVARELSPVGKIRLEFFEDDPTQTKKVEINGVELLDYMLMYKKYQPGERDFSLDSFAEDFLKENKVENPTGGSFRDFYTGEFDFTGEPVNEIQTLAKERTALRNKTDSESVARFNELDKLIRDKCWNAFTWYNIRDVDIVHRLEARLGMLGLTYTISYLVGMNYSDVFGTVKPWDIFLQNENHREGIFTSVEDGQGVMPRELMGGFVHLYKGGLYKDGATLDATSLN